MRVTEYKRLEQELQSALQKIRTASPIEVDGAYELYRAASAALWAEILRLRELGKRRV